MASSSQNQLSFSSAAHSQAEWAAKWNDWETVYSSHYLRLLLGELDKPSTKGLPQAQQGVEQQIKDLDSSRKESDPRYQQPVSTFNLPGGGGCLDCWQKDDHDAKRYALLCGSDHGDIAKMKKTLKTVYGLSDKQIISLNSPNAWDVEEQIRRLGLRANHALKHGKKPELLLFISGHGHADYSKTTTKSRFQQELAAKQRLIDELYQGDFDQYWDASMDTWRLPGEASKLSLADQERFQYFKARYQNATDEIGRLIEENSLEGQKNGRVQLKLHSFRSLREEDVKRWVVNYIPKKTKGLVIVQSCHSGSWTG
jgi:hypothetical protein